MTSPANRQERLNGNKRKALPKKKAHAKTLSRQGNQIQEFETKKIFPFLAS
jgi:hypothetical protein